MKRLLVFVLIIINTISYTQGIINIDNLISKYPTYFFGYFDEEGRTLFNGKVTPENIGENYKHEDFLKIYDAGFRMFEGDWYESKAVFIYYYLDENKKPTSVKFIQFLNENGDKIGTEIHFWKNGDIKSIDHY